jgi:hypothetical protein
VSVHGAVVFAGRAVRAVKQLARSGRIPRPLKLLVLIGLLPVPGPFDEVVLLLAAAILFLFYRGEMTRAWCDSRVSE